MARALRGKKPEERNPRLKLLLAGEAGVGKTVAAIQMPRPYIIDCEDGTPHYTKQIEASGGLVFQTNSVDEVIEEVRTLMSTEHPYLTLVIDPFTAIYDTELDRAEKEVGNEFGRHYGVANKSMKRLYNLLTELDMNVIVTAHAKNEYGEAMKVVGKTFEGWKKLDYLFDLFLFLERDKAGARFATVKKTRIEGFEDQSKFGWSYDALAERYGRDKIERKPVAVELPDPSLIADFKAAYAQLNEAEIKRLKIDKVVTSLDDVADLPKSRLEKGLEVLRNYLNSIAA
jgi:hypothetical protein